MHLISLVGLHLNSNKVPNTIMTKTTKNKKPTASPGSINNKTKLTSSKKSNERTSKKALQKGNGAGVQKRKSTDARSVPRTPDRKQRKSHLLRSTPNTVSSNSTTSSKRAISMMSGLALESLPRKVKRAQDVPRKACLSDTVDLDDASMIAWTCEKGLQVALEYHFVDRDDFDGMEYYDRVLMLCNKFKPNDIRPAFQGICQDAGRDWRTLKLQKHRSMKSLAPEFSKACVDIVNAKAELLELENRTVPQKITIKKEKIEQSATL